MIPGIVAQAAPGAATDHGLSNRWRIYVTGKPRSDSYVSACEVEMFSTPGGPNRATGGTASASTTQTSGAYVPSGGWTPALAFDGVKTNVSAWTAYNSSTPQWLEYLFPSAVTVEEIIIYTKHNDPGGTPSTFVVQYWDGAAWVNYWTETWSNSAFPNASGSTVGLKFSRTKGRRKWRINFTAKGSSSSWFSIYEIEFRETSGGASINHGAFPSSNYNTGSAYQLFDGDYATLWQSGSTATPLNVGLYFNKDVPEIGEIVIKGGSTANDSPTAGNVQYYDEVTSSWVTSWSFSGLTWTSNETKTITKPTP